MSHCSVCAEEFTTQLRKTVTCPYCQYDACTKCVKTYLLSSSQEPHCMNCFKGWNFDFVSTFASPTWLNGDYKNHKRQILFDHEKAMLPASQHMVQNYKKCQDMKKQISSLEKDIVERQNRIFQLRRQVNAFEQNRYVSNATTDHTTKQSFIKACPSDGCRGFLSTQYKCGTCEVFVCSGCLEIKGMSRDADHQCDPDKLASAQLIAKDSKPCPKCASLIFKISGCDQMYCTQCHTAFSWKTGRIEKGVIHNPHHYEFLMQQHGHVPRNPLDVVCGGIPGINHVIQHLFDLKIPREIRNRITDMHRMSRHIRQTMLAPIDNDERTNADLRLKYLIKELDDDTFARMIYNRHISNVRKQTFNDIYIMAADISEELFRKLLASDKSYVSEFLREMDALKQYVNDNLRKYCNTYRVKPRWIEW